MKPRPLARAPITECLLDIRVSPADGVGTDALRTMGPRLQPRYAEEEALHRLTQHFNPGLTDQPAPQRELVGYVFRTSDRRNVVQVQRDGLTVSLLAPYRDWSELQEEAKRVWDVYLAALRPRLVTRIGTRFLNRMELPLPVDFKDWLLSYPELGESVGPGFSSYFMRLEVPLERGMGIITQMTEPGFHAERLPVIIDVDAFLAAEFQPEGAALWPAIDKLRDAKNRLFFGSVTERAGDELFT